MTSFCGGPARAPLPHPPSPRRPGSKYSRARSRALAHAGAHAEPHVRGGRGACACALHTLAAPRFPLAETAPLWPPESWGGTAPPLPPPSPSPGRARWVEGGDSRPQGWDPGRERHAQAGGPGGDTVYRVAPGCAPGRLAGPGPPPPPRGGSAAEPRSGWEAAWQAGDWALRPDGGDDHEASRARMWSG